MLCGHHFLVTWLLCTRDSSSAPSYTSPTAFSESLCDLFFVSSSFCSFLVIILTPSPPPHTHTHTQHCMYTGFVLGGSAVGKKGEGGRETKDRLSLKWSTPKTSSLDLQPCTSAYRVTPTNVSVTPTNVSIITSSLAPNITVGSKLIFF